MSDRRGQSVVEFALIVPIFLLMVLGVVEFGRAWNIHQVVQEAAREAVRVGVVYQGSDHNEMRADITEVVSRNLALVGLDPAAADIVIGEGAGDASIVNLGAPVRVSVSYPYAFSFLRPFIAWSDDEALIDLVGVSVMRKE